MWGDISMSFIFAFIWWLVRFRLCSSSFLTPSHADHLSILDGAREKWVFWSASHTVGSQILIYSHFPRQENFRQGDLSWHWVALSSAGLTWVKWNSTSYYLICIQPQIFFFSNGVLELLSWTLRLLRGILVCEWLSDGCSLGWRG